MSFVMSLNTFFRKCHPYQLRQLNKVHEIACTGNTRRRYSYCLIVLSRNLSSTCYVSQQRKAENEIKPSETGGPSSGTEIDVKRQNPYAHLTFGQKVKEAGKDFTYLTISVIAIGVLGAMFYYIGRELFSSDSPNGVYSKALKRCINDSEVTVALGAPIKGFGEETRRGRRRHVNHLEFVQDGRKHMRMKFYIQGTDRKADVNLEVVQDDSSTYNYRYLFVQLEEFPYRTIILEDNR